MNKLTVNSQDSLSEAIGTLRQTFKDKKYFQVTINTGKRRSLDQNAVLHVWLAQVCRELKEYHEPKLKCLWKLHYGLPILRGEDEEYNIACSRFIDPLPYADQVDAMEFFPCTRLMSTKQKNRLLETLQEHYLGRVELTFKKEG